MSIPPFMEIRDEDVEVQLEDIERRAREIDKVRDELEVLSDETQRRIAKLKAAEHTTQQITLFKAEIVYNGVGGPKRENMEGRFVGYKINGGILSFIESNKGPSANATGNFKVNRREVVSSIGESDLSGGRSGYVIVNPNTTERILIIPSSSLMSAEITKIKGDLSSKSTEAAVRKLNVNAGEKEGSDAQ